MLHAPSNLEVDYEDVDVLVPALNGCGSVFFPDLWGLPCVFLVDSQGYTLVLVSAVCFLMNLPKSLISKFPYEIYAGGYYT